MNHLKRMLAMIVSLGLVCGVMPPQAEAWAAPAAPQETYAPLTESDLDGNRLTNPPVRIAGCVF